MKERIVIDEDFYVKHFQDREKDFYEEDMCSGGNPEEWWHYEKEQVPETFEELKELCKELKGISFGKTGQTQETEYIAIDNSLYFYKDGTIDFGFDNLAYTITPARQWQIIKSLIGVE